MFVHFYFRTQLYRFYILLKISAPGVNDTKIVQALGPK